MFKFKKILNLIDKGVIETREELELFLHYAGTGEHIDFGVVTGINVGMGFEKKLVHITGGKAQSDLPLKIHNPDNVTSTKVYAAMEFMIREMVKSNFKESYFSPVYYELFLDENGHMFTKMSAENQTLNEEWISISKEDNRSGNEEVEAGYFKYLHDSGLEHTDRNFDIYFNGYLESEDFEAYLDGVMERFYKALEE